MCSIQINPECKLRISIGYYTIVLLLYYLDLGSDLWLTYLYYEKSNWIHFSFTFGFILFPFLVRVIYNEKSSNKKLTASERFKTYLLSFFLIEMIYV